eukprot:5731868-Pyramimonas_sp.AAC.1
MKGTTTPRTTLDKTFRNNVPLTNLFQVFSRVGVPAQRKYKRAHKFAHVSPGKRPLVTRQEDPRRSPAELGLCV